jgi:hypothetical protein
MFTNSFDETNTASYKFPRKYMFFLSTHYLSVGYTNKLIFIGDHC